MKYFTTKGVQQVKERYKNLIHSDFYFDATEKKYKLDEIVEQPAQNTKDCFYIRFNSYNSDTPISSVIYDFMALNKIDYNFHDFETKTVDK